MTGNAVRLHGVLRAAPERIYRAFLDAARFLRLGEREIAKHHGR